MKCPICSSDLLWLDDYDFTEENDGKFAVTSYYECRSKRCNAYIDITCRDKETDDD
jgi:hypothetical protein